MPFYNGQWLEMLPIDQFRALQASHTVFGYHYESHDDFYVPNIDRYSGTYVLGVPGSGKSGLLQNLIAKDMQRGAVIVIDPHGDLITNCLHDIPPAALPDTFLLDMEDEAFPFGINLFNTGKFTTDIQFSQAVSRIEHVFQVLWPDVLAQANLPRYLRMATIVFLANPGKTLVDMYTFLLDDAFRRKLLQSVNDPTVKQFWQLQYDNLPPATRLSRVQPLLGRLEQLFAGRSLVRNIVGQAASSIDFRKAIEAKQIIFIKLPLRTAEQDARLIGTILLTQIHAALFSFIDLPADKRPGVSLYMDEFQNFATEDIQELLSEGRKFGMRLTVAHQNRSQLTIKGLQEATMGVRTIVCFQLTPKDGAELAHLFPVPAQRVKPEHVDPHPSETLLNFPHLHPEIVQEFIECYLRPVQLLQVGSHGNKIAIHDAGYGLHDLGWSMVAPRDSRGSYKPPEAYNPLVYTDYLLQQVMVTGLYLAPIPAVAVKGFANCGVSFWQKVRFMRDNDWRLSADIPDLHIPDHLAGQLPDGSYYWKRRPESGTEQLYHFLFHLRITMRYLAEHPLGKQTQMTTAEVGKMLNSLQRRAAFIRSGEHIGAIYTHNTAGKLDDSRYWQRLSFIRMQTRQTYCQPRDKVEQALLGTAAPPPEPPPIVPAPPAPAPLADTTVQPQLSGWEEAE